MHMHTGHPPRGNWLAMGAAVVAAGILMLLPCGCKELFGEGPRGRVKLGNGRLVVVPFATPPKRKHFESEIGKLFARTVADLVREGCPAARVVATDEFPESIEGQSLDALSPIELGQALSANYVAIGEIHELQAKEPGSYKLLKGTIVISARVYDVKDEALIWQITKQKFHWPRLVGGEMVPADTEDEEEVIRKTMREAAWAVAAVFRGPRSDRDLLLGN